MSTGAKPILIGGSFTPTWHVPSCPCDKCVAWRANGDAILSALKEVNEDPVKKAELDASIAASFEKGRERARAYRESSRSSACGCRCCRRY